MHTFIDSFTELFVFVMAPVLHFYQTRMNLRTCMQMLIETCICMHVGSGHGSTHWMTEVTIKGVLNVDYSARVQGNKAKMRMIYYCEPVSEEAANNPKNWVDRESQKAEWKTVAELRQFKEKRMLRGTELLEWAEYLEAGGHVYPSAMFSPEQAQPQKAQASVSFTSQDE